MLTALLCWGNPNIQRARDMRTSKLPKLFSIALITAIVFSSPLQSVAASKDKQKAEDTEKSRLVFMPLRVPPEDRNLTGAMETALVEGLQQKYVVFSGEQVSQKAREIFLKESRNTAHKECDETKCMQNIAIAFQAELIATANVSKQDGSYFLALSIQNIFDNKVEYSKSLTCENCTAVQVINKLKELGGKGNGSADGRSVVENQTPYSFDGHWSVKLECDDVRVNGDFVKGYISMFEVIVEKGKLEGQYGTAGSPGSVTYIGQVQSNGKVEIEARGNTGKSDYTVGKLTKGTPYAYYMKGEFSGLTGHASRTSVRPCEATFTKR
jgi:hypothetical protein